MPNLESLPHPHGLEEAPVVHQPGPFIYERFPPRFKMVKVLGRDELRCHNNNPQFGRPLTNSTVLDYNIQGRILTLGHIDSTEIQYAGG